MNVRLMYRDRDYRPIDKWTKIQEDTAKDLGLEILLKAMGRKDKYLREVCGSVVFDNLLRKEDILYRQEILKDCLANPDVIRKLYRITQDTFEEKQKNYWSFSSRYLGAIMSTSVGLLKMLVRMLWELRRTADESQGLFRSEGICALFEMLRSELTDEYFKELEFHLHQLQFRDGVLISAQIGEGNIGGGYTLHSLPCDLKNKIKWRFAPKFAIHPRDDRGASELTRRKDKAINLAANAVAQSAEHILDFFTALQTELAFYVGCLNLYEKLAAKGEPICFPKPRDMCGFSHSFAGLYDVCLSLAIADRTVGNCADMGGRKLAVITGANQGGKSTFLRSVGQAQLMLQCGMFVAAESFEANIASGIFTHFNREEDSSMKRGKLDEELSRMSFLVDEIKPRGLILFNESFASTNEREGSEIARQIVKALLDEQIKVFLVTHMFDLSGGFYRQYGNSALFLRAGRDEGGGRSFRLAEGEPLPTSFGEDLFYKVFGNEE